MAHPTPAPVYTAEIEAALAKLGAASAGRARSVPQAGGSAATAITSVLCDDGATPLDLPNFNAIEWINNRFQDAASLDGLSDFMTEVRQRLDETEEELSAAVALQARSAASAGADLEDAKRAVASLHGRVQEIQMKATDSEKAVSDICSSIRDLDTAKRNLDDSVNTIMQMQLWITSLRNLRIFFTARDYDRLGDALRSAQRSSNKFSRFENLDKVKELQRSFTDLKREISAALVDEILHKLHASASRGEAQAAARAGGPPPAGPSGPVAPVDSHEALRGACSVLDALGDGAVAQVRQAFIAKILDLYRIQFPPSSEKSTLVNTHERFKWFRGVLDRHEDLLRHTLPLEWYVMQELTTEFCLVTGRDLTQQLRDNEGSIDAALLVVVLETTMSFEDELSKRMKMYEFAIKEEREQLSRDSVGDDNQSGDNPVREFKVHGFVTSAFDAHMGNWVDAQRVNMRRAMETDAKEIDSELLIFESTSNVFLFIESSLKRAQRIINARSSHVMGNLVAVWHDNMQIYAKSLLDAASKVPTTADEEARLCIVVNSADYCRNTAEELNSQLVRVLESRDAMAGGDAVVEDFSQACSYAVTQLAECVCRHLDSLVNDYQAQLASGGTAATAAHATMDALVESNFVPSIRRALVEHFLLCRYHIVSDPLFAFFVKKTADLFLPRLARVIYKPRGKLTDFMTSQLQIDLKSLEATFLSCPSEALAKLHAGALPGTKVVQHTSRRLTASSIDGGDGVAGTAATFTNQAYTKSVRTEIQRLLAVLKVLLIPPGDNFVNLYYQIVRPEDRSSTDCGRLLELQGVSPSEMRQWVAQLKKKDVPETTKRDVFIADLCGFMTNIPALAPTVITDSARDVGTRLMSVVNLATGAVGLTSQQQELSIAQVAAQRRGASAPQPAGTGDQLRAKLSGFFRSTK